MDSKEHLNKMVTEKVTVKKKLIAMVFISPEGNQHYVPIEEAPNFKEIFKVTDNWTIKEKF